MAQPFLNQNNNMAGPPGHVEAILWMGSSGSAIRWVGAVVNYADTTGQCVLAVMTPGGTYAERMPRVAAAQHLQALASKQDALGYAHVDPDAGTVGSVLPVLITTADVAYATGAESTLHTTLASETNPPVKNLVGQFGQIEYARLVSKNDKTDWTGIISHYDGYHVLAWADDKRVVARRLPAGLCGPATYPYLNALQAVANQQIKGKAHILAHWDHRAISLQHWVDTIHSALPPALPSMMPKPGNMKLLWESATDMSQWKVPPAIAPVDPQAFSLVSTATAPPATAFAFAVNSTTTANPWTYTVNGETYNVVWDDQQGWTSPPTAQPPATPATPVVPTIDGDPPSGDLACDRATCRHRLSSHLPSNGDGELNTCIADGCACEVWRRICEECKRISLAWVTRHFAGCKTGELERADSARRRSLSRNRPRRQAIDVPDDF